MGPQKNSPASETYSVSSPSLANANRKAWEAISNQLFISGLILEKNNNYILYQVAKSVAYLARGCITHAMVEREPQQQGQKGDFSFACDGEHRHL